MTGLRVTAVTTSYGRGARVLDRLDLTVPDGELTAVLGPSGCGKTTLLRVIAGFLTPDTGEISLGERTVSGPGVHVPPERRGVGIVAQEGALFPHMDVARNVAFGLRGVGRAERRARAAEMLELVGLGSYGTRMPHELSGGQQQRVALARALAPRPALVLLDEPFNALDSALRAGLRSDVRTALRAAGTTALLVTHDQEEALSSADRIAVIRDGGVVQTGTPQEVYARPADTWVASFIGAAVLLPARVKASHAITVLGRIPLTEPTPEGTRTGTVILRPEQLRLVPASEASGTRARVTEVRYHGHDALILLTTDGLSTPITVRTTGPITIHAGDETGIAVAGTAILHPHRNPLPDNAG